MFDIHLIGKIDGDLEFSIVVVVVISLYKLEI